jgi:hypothetical protein
MSPARMNWRRARLASRPSLDHRWDDPGSEFAPDRAGRWLAKAERRPRERAHHLASSTVAGAGQTHHLAGARGSSSQ